MHIHTLYIYRYNKNLEFDKEVGIALKIRKQVASLAARLVRNSELYMHVRNYL